MSPSADWPDLSHVRSAVSGSGLRAVGGVNQAAGHAQQQQRHAHSDRPRSLPAGGKSGYKNKWSAENTYAWLRSIGRAIVGAPMSPYGPKHSASDDVEVGPYPAMNGINYGVQQANGWNHVVDTREGVGKRGGRSRGLAITKRRVPLMLMFTAMLLIFLGVRQSPRPTWQGFVTVRDLQMEADCRPFLIAGFNAHHLVTNVLVLPAHYKTPGNRKGRDIVRQALRHARGAGLNTLRTFAHTTDDNFPFQASPGVLHEATFRALDWLLDEARTQGLRVILSFCDNWKYPGGVDEYVDASDTVPPRTQERPPDEEGDSVFVVQDESAKHYEVARHALFFNDTGAKRLYRDYAAAIINRSNSRTGVLYRDDPTILAWDLINEPRCETWKVPDCVNMMQEWIEEMASFVKTLDPNHLVTVGAEGFWAQGATREDANPGGWALQSGQNFSVNHAPASIDFAAIHVWPDNWERTSEQFQTRWVMSHLQEMEEGIRKPLLLEEFGKKLNPSEYKNGSIASKRDPVFHSVYSTIETALDTDRGLAGSLFWRWDVQVYADSAVADYGVSQQDSTFGTIQRHAAKVRQKAAARPPRPECRLGCWVKRKSALVRGCEHKPHICAEYWDSADVAEYTTAAAAGSRRGQNETHPGVHLSMPPAQPGLEVYPTEAACCHAGLGAFVNGCSLMSSVL